jgi:hypothetical protein
LPEHSPDALRAQESALRAQEKFLRAQRTSKRT